MAFRPGQLAWLRRPVMGLTLTMVACAVLLGLLHVPFVSALDRHIYDSRIRAFGGTADDQVVIVDVDEASLAAQGRWPWPRATIAKLLDRLTGKGGARVVGVDVVFADPDRDPEGDDALARVLRNRPIVLGYYFTSERGGVTSGKLPEPVLPVSALPANVRTVTSWNGYGANLESLESQAAGSGFFNSLVDTDGVVRALPMLAEYHGSLYESFVVAVLRVWLGGASVSVADGNLVLQGPRGAVRLPLSTGMSALIPYSAIQGRDASSQAAVAGASSHDADGATSGASQRFRYVSASDVLAGRVDPAVFRGRIVLVGTSAPGLADLRATPVRASLPGVELHATMIAGALDKTPHAIKRRANESKLVALIVTVAVGIALSFGLPQLGPLGAVMLSAVAAGTVWLTGAIAWSNYGLAVPSTVGLLLVVSSALLYLAFGYFLESRARHAVANVFGQYVSPALVERMMANPARYSQVASENRELTVLFVDIRGFTRIAETMQPEDLREYINAFLTAMTEVVHRYGGTIDKYIGDAVMAFWGAPVDDPQHADHAVAAALAMLEEVRRLNRDFETRALPLMRVGIGINTGVARVGDMGSRLRRAYTAIGSTVNLASRFEGLTERFGATILVGEATKAQARGHAFVELGSAPVVGLSEPVRVFTPAALAQDRTGLRAGERDREGSGGGDRADEATRIGL